MTCANCGGHVEIVEEEGGIDEGRFTEIYKCKSCSAMGTVSGLADDPPRRWTRGGIVFTGGHR